MLGNFVLVTICLLTISNVVSTEEDGHHKDVCHLFSEKNYKIPLISLRSNIKVFATALVFQQDSEKGIEVQSVRLDTGSSPCSVVICDSKHLRGNCTQITQSTPQISLLDKVHLNVHSVDCHCATATKSKTTGPPVSPNPEGTPPSPSAEPIQPGSEGTPPSDPSPPPPSSEGQHHLSSEPSPPPSSEGQHRQSSEALPPPPPPSSEGTQQPSPSSEPLPHPPPPSSDGTPHPSQSSEPLPPASPPSSEGTPSSPPPTTEEETDKVKLITNEKLVQLKKIIVQPSSTEKPPGPEPEIFECANIYRNWFYQGSSVQLIFPGSTAKIDPEERIRSINVDEKCKLILWGNSKTQPGRNGHGFADTFAQFTDSTSFIQLNETYSWGCCYCDEIAETVCSKAHQLYIKGSVPKSPPNITDFSQFVKHGKKIVGIGRNYLWEKVDLAHVLMAQKEPIVFTKPSSSYITEGQKIELPQSLGPIAYEIELGVVIGKKARHVTEANALDYVAGYFLALDMTAKSFIKGREGQGNLPWALGKGFDTACPVGEFVPKSRVPDPNNVHLEAKVNGKLTQSENTNKMIFNVQKLIAYVSRYMTLEPFDTILTGTPDGFSAVKEGDVITGRLSNITNIKFTTVNVNS